METLPTDLERAEQALQQARHKGDLDAINAANKRIQEIRERITKSRTALSKLAGERMHLLEIVEQAQNQLRRCERNLEYHDMRIEKIRDEIRQMGGSVRVFPGKEAAPTEQGE